MKNLNKPTVAQRTEAFGEFIKEQRAILLGKGHDYTAGQAEKDAYANFRIIADLLDGAPITPYTVCMIYFLKHVFSLITFTKTGVQESGEGLRGRHLDVADYAFILDQLVPDHLNYFIDRRNETREELEQIMEDALIKTREYAYKRTHGNKDQQMADEGGDACIGKCKHVGGTKVSDHPYLFPMDEKDNATSTLNIKED